MGTELNAGACRKRAAPSVLGDDDTASLLRSIERELARRFGGTLAPDGRHELACRARDEFAALPVTNYLPILAERRAIDLAAARVGSQRATQPSTH